MAKRIMMSKYFTRCPEGDFSDDGSYFRMYSYEHIDGTIMNISYLNSDGFVYISPRAYDLKGDMTYDELSIKCPTYKDLDIYNYCDPNNVDLERLYSMCGKFIEEVKEAKKTISPVDPKLIEDYVNRYNNRVDEIKKVVKENLTIDYLANVSDSYDRKALLEGYIDTMKMTKISSEDVLKRGRSSALDRIKCSSMPHIPYYIEKYFFKEIKCTR